MAKSTNEEADYRVIIAGGGVAALEAVLALAAFSDGTLELEVVAPEPEFTIRALSVTEPFGGPPQRALDLAAFCEEHGATLRQDRLAEIWGEQQRILLDSGRDLPYDALLLAVGAQPYRVLPGAHAFRGSADAHWFAELLEGMERGEIRRVAFAVPAGVRWSLPLYELALMTAHRMRERGVEGVELTFVTHEDAPFSVFESPEQSRVAGLLSAAGIELLTGHAPVRFDERLLLENGRAIEADCVVALPGLRVPAIPGLPAVGRGYIPTDAEMRVDGLRNVWAVGDATWFPIKQGGIAAQQAEVAAASIAAASGMHVTVPAFAPVIRASLMTGAGVENIRGDVGGDPVVSSSPLWWPPGKVAGRRLAPYLARLWAGEPSDPLGPLEDLEARSGEAAEEAEREHRAAVEMALAWADADAGAGEYAQALRWLDVAEKLDLTLPPEYAANRVEWTRRSAPRD